MVVISGIGVGEFAGTAVGVEAVVVSVPKSMAKRLCPISLALSPIVVVFPCPNCPLIDDPQHFIVIILATMVQLWAAPIEIEDAANPLPISTIGKESPICPLLVPQLSIECCPSCPVLAAPQHFIFLFLKRAHV